MALYKEIEMPTGVYASYHRILQIHLDKDGHTIFIVASYANRNVRERDMNNEHNVALAINNYVIELNEPSISYSEAYILLKNFPEFENAEDILENES